MSDLNLDLVRRQFELLNERNREAAPSTWSEDVVLIVHERGLDSGTYVGRHAAARWFESWFSQFRGDYSFEFEDVREIGDAVVTVTHHRGTGLASGANVEATTANVFWTRDGLVVRIELFWDDIQGAMVAASRLRPE